MWKGPGPVEDDNPYRPPALDSQRSEAEPSLPPSTGGAGDDRIQDAIVLAKNLWNNGMPRERIADRLLTRGLDEAGVESVLAHVPLEEAENLVVGTRSAPIHPGIIIGIGVTISLMGILLIFSTIIGGVFRTSRIGYGLVVVGLSVIARGLR